MKAFGTTRDFSGVIFSIAGLALAVTACGKPAAEPAATAAAPAATAPAAQAAAQPAAPVVTPPPAAVWPDPVPETWLVVNDYETTADLSEPAIDPRTRKPIPKVNKPTNLLGGEWGDVGFNAGKCTLEQVRDGNNTILKVSFNMPAETSECGTFEYLMPAIEKRVDNRLIRNYPQSFDLRPYDRITAMVKSGDGKEHNLRLHITELDPYASQLQGYASPTENIVAGPEWRRVEFQLDKTLHQFFDRRHGKLIGLRIRVQELAEGETSGVILFDNIALIKKTGN